MEISKLILIFASTELKASFIKQHNRMKKIGKIIITAFAVLTLFSCENKESYIQDFSQFIQDVEDHADTYTDKDWEKADKKFENFTGSIYKKYAEELTSDEKMEIAKCQTTYTALKAKAGIKNTWDNLKEAAQKAKEAFEEEK